MIRKFNPNEKDYLKYVDIFCRTSFSFHIGIPSEKIDNIGESAIPSFAFYCNKISNFIYYYSCFEDENGDIIAGVEYTLNYYSRCTILHFVVLPDYQLKGNGTKFYQELETFLKNGNISNILLFSFTPGSIAFWKKMGFKEEKNGYVKYLK